MLTEERIRGLFYEFLPEGIGIMSTLSAQEFTEQARHHPFIQMQIQIGIYSDDNLAEDFLSPARAHPDLGLQVICVEIFERLLEGIPNDIAEDYVRAVAAHEAHHFHTDHGPVSAADHAQNELQCVTEIAAAHPELDRASRYVEEHSPVYRRVYQRMAEIQNRLQKGVTAR